VGVEVEAVFSLMWLTVLSPNHHRIQGMAKPKNHSGASMPSTTTWAMVAAKMMVTMGLVLFLSMSPMFISLGLINQGNSEKPNKLGNYSYAPLRNLRF